MPKRIPKSKMKRFEDFTGSIEFLKESLINNLKEEIATLHKPVLSMSKKTLISLHYLESRGLGFKKPRWLKLDPNNERFYTEDSKGYIKISTMVPDGVVSYFVEKEGEHIFGRIHFQEEFAFLDEDMEDFNMKAFWESKRSHQLNERVAELENLNKNVS